MQVIGNNWKSKDFTRKSFEIVGRMRPTLLDGSHGGSKSAKKQVFVFICIGNKWESEDSFKFNGNDVKFCEFIRDPTKA